MIQSCFINFGTVWLRPDWWEEWRYGIKDSWMRFVSFRTSTTINLSLRHGGWEEWLNCWWSNRWWKDVRKWGWGNFICLRPGWWEDWHYGIGIMMREVWRYLVLFWTNISVRLVGWEEWIMMIEVWRYLVVFWTRISVRLVGWEEWCNGRLLREVWICSIPARLHLGWSWWGNHHPTSNSSPQQLRSETKITANTTENQIETPWPTTQYLIWKRRERESVREEEETKIIKPFSLEHF